MKSNTSENTLIDKSQNNKPFFLEKIIKLKEQDLEFAKEIEIKLKLSSISSRVLSARKFTDIEKIRNYINPKLSQLPHIDNIKCLKDACLLIKKFIDDNKKLAICCDFDVDGLTGGSQLYELLLSLGANIIIIVPDRFKDGYGLSKNIVKKVIDNGTNLLICIDFGTRNILEIDEIKKCGISSIIVDHHEVGEDIPDADVFVNPKQKGCGFENGNLSASGLTWYLIAGLKSYCQYNFDPKDYLELAALGTICDMVPLTGANRIIAKYGLEIISKSKRIGCKAIIDAIGLKREIRCSDVSFLIGPRINAAGRIANADVVYTLFSTKDQKIAQKIAQKLNNLNNERQLEEENVKNLALGIIKKSGFIPHGIVLWDKDFHTGVIGIVAQRMIENFYRPAAIIGYDSEGIYKGSVRGIPGISVVELLESLSKYLIKYGGHVGAGGFSIKEENLESFAEDFNSECEKKFIDISLNPVITVDTEAKIDELHFSVLDEFAKFSPFGIGNASPVILLREVTVSEVHSIKDAHLKAVITDGQNYINAILWRTPYHPFIYKGNRINLAIKLDRNTFQGTNCLQGIIQAVEES